jgi:imidazoleglycerol phosphate synthase glutamine amidotransferase subunit HisH
MRKNRKWIFGIKIGNGMMVHMEEESESVAACAQIKDDIKQMKTT